MTETEKDALLRRYADGLAGTRQTIEALGMRDYADLVIAMAQGGLDFPKPSDTPAHAAHLARARAIPLPRLRRDG